MKKSTDPISRGAKLFKPFIVKRPNGGCQILFPLSELDYLLGKLSKAMELPKSLMEEQKNRKANGAGQGAAKPYPEPAGSASLVAQPPRDVSELYHELLYAVARKFSGESRHETALRYIRDTEERAGGTGSCKQNTAVSGANGGLPK